MPVKKDDTKTAKQPLKEGPDIKKCRGAMSAVLTEQIGFAKIQGDDHHEMTFFNVLKKLKYKWQTEADKMA